MKDPLEVSSLARGVMLPSGATPVRFVTNRPSLFPASSTRRPMGLPYGSLSQLRESAGLTVFRPIDLMNGLGSLFPPMALIAHDRGGFSPATRHVAFWPKPISTFGLFYITMFIKSSPGLAMPFDPSSRSALVLAEMRSPHSLRTNPKVQATLSEGSTRFVTASHFLLGYG